MFKDLKEYQEITRIYHESVNISEQQRAINKAIAEAGFTDEEILYLDENFDEIWESELATLTEEVISDCLVEENLTEEQLQEVVKKLAPKAAKAGAGAATGIGGMIKKGISAVKKKIPQGIKDTVSGAKSVAQSAMKKVGGVVKKVAPKVLKAAPLLGAGGLAVAGIAGGINALRKKGKAKREAELDAKIKQGIKDSGMGDKGTSMTMQGIKDASYNRGVKAAEDRAKAQQSKATETKPKKKMHPIEKKNRARFGDEKVDKLKAKQVDFKAMRKGTMSKADFIKKYPKSITAQKAAGLRDHTEWDAYDMVLEYLFSTEQVSTIEEANYVMMEMDQETIGSIVSEVKYVLDEGFIDNIKAGVKKVKDAVGGVKDKVEKRIERRKENVAINKRIKEKEANPDSKTKAQIMALNRKKEKLNDPTGYAKKQAMTGKEKAQALAKARIAAKKEENKPRGRVR